MPTYTMIQILLTVFSIIFLVFIINLLLYIPVIIKNKKLQKDFELRLEEFKKDIYGMKDHR